MIRAERLSKAFDGFWAVRDVSLTVHKGEILALLGPNGAGKTTTVRMLSAILAPTTGEAWVDGYSVREHPQEVRRRVGVLTEHHGLYRRMTVEEYLAFFADVYELPETVKRERIAHWLRFFDLWAFRHRRIGELSKGMRQKVALTRALLHHPRALLLDEPTSAMDPESAYLVRQAVAALRSEERAIILCTHNLVEAESLADRIAVLHRGRVVALGTAEELKRRFLGPKRYRVLLAEDRAEPPPLPPGFRLVAHSPRAFEVHPPNGEGDNVHLIRTLVHAGWPVVRVEAVPYTLEQAYLALMKQVHAQEAAQTGQEEPTHG